MCKTYHSLRFRLVVTIRGLRTRVIVYMVRIRSGWFRILINRWLIRLIPVRIFIFGRSFRSFISAIRSARGIHRSVTRSRWTHGVTLFLLETRVIVDKCVECVSFDNLCTRIIYLQSNWCWEGGRRVNELISERRVEMGMDGDKASRRENEESTWGHYVNHHTTLIEIAASVNSYT